MTAPTNISSDISAAQSSNQPSNDQSISTSPRDLALAARSSSLWLQSQPTSVRSRVLESFNQVISQSTDYLLAENQKDIDALNSRSNDQPNNQQLKARLKLDATKLAVLSDGINQLINQPDQIGQSTEIRELTPGLILEKKICPLGVLLVIFESRPEVYPQLVSLCVKSGNAVLLKGGQESLQSLKAFHNLFLQACEHVAKELNQSSEKSEEHPAKRQKTDRSINQSNTQSNNPLLSLVTLLETRESVSSLLSLHDVIDLVIPRGSNQLVDYIQSNTRIPVMGHADGVCHLYIDQSIDQCICPTESDDQIDSSNQTNTQSIDRSMAIQIAVDSKCDYPAACNAVETILVHEALCKNQSNNQSNQLFVHDLIDALQAKNVQCFIAPKLWDLLQNQSVHQSKLKPLPHGYQHEYGDLSVTIEVIESINHAIEHINKYGSHHTDSIVTRSIKQSIDFMNCIDSACVFINSSTRFADGYRFGLGAEVGVSTGRLHARGPVGVQGLLTYKWTATSKTGHTLAQQKEGKWQYTHKELPIVQPQNQ